MRKKIILNIFTVCLLLAPFLLAQEGYYRYQFARVQYVQGDVILQTAEGVEEAAEVNYVIAEGNILITREGRAEVYFGRGNDLRLDNWTKVEFLNLPRSEREKTKIRIFEGSVYLRLRNLGHEKEYEIHTADASFYILEEGLYRLDVNPQDTQISVIEGAGEVAGDEQSVLLEKGERLLATRGDLSSPRRVSFERDDFASWNKERDARDVKTSSRYLPPELAEYEYELEAHGRWVYERPWGYVWVPIIIYSDWRPYYYGRWVWYPLIGWTWIPYEPWGWCVFHFGRWHWRFGLGWYWIPTIYWGPAWVYWWSGYDYFGWVPLSYYNRPVVIINNVFYDRYYETVYPIHSRALTVVRKDQLMAPRIHEVALRENQILSLSHLSLRAARSEELNSLVRANSLRSVPSMPSLKQLKTGESTPNEQSRILRRESLGSVSPQLRPSTISSRGEDSPKNSSRSTFDSPQLRQVESQRLSPLNSSPDNQERRIRPEKGSLSGVKVDPTRLQPSKKINEDGLSSIERKKDDELIRPSRLTSSSISSNRESGVSSFSGSSSPLNYLRSRLTERTSPSRNIRPSSSSPSYRSSDSSSWRLPSINRLPSVTSIPRISMPSVSSRSTNLSPSSISPPTISSRPSSGSISPPSASRIRKK